MVIGAVVGLAIALGVTASGAEATQTWQPSEAQLEQALAVMQAEAWTSSPQAAAAGNAGPAVVQDVLAGRLTAPTSDTSLPNAWPPDTTAVSYVVSSRSTAEQWIDGTVAPDNRPVIVARLLGSFRWITSGPPGAPTPSGTVVTILIDPESGQVTDAGLEQDQAASNRLPGATTVFER